MDKKRPIIVLCLLAAVAAGLYVLLKDKQDVNQAPRAWGFVDTRSVALAFERSARIVTLTREEGERVKAGDVLGILDTQALEIDASRVSAEIKRLEASLSLVKEGARREDIAAAEAELRAAEAALSLAELTDRRQNALWQAKAGSAQLRDQAHQNLLAAQAKAAALRATLEKLHAGSRPQEVAAAAAALDAARAQLAALRHSIDVSSVLRAPTDALVRSRLAEPGDMASASRTVYRLSMDNPKWVRAYLTEARLNEVHEGQIVTVRTDTTAPLTGRISFISDTAEFTPKSVQTEELRTALVYEFKVEVDDPEHKLRQGQPVTVLLAPQ